MSDESLLVKDLSEAEKDRIIQSFKELQLSGVPLKMKVSEAEALITRKRTEKTIQNIENNETKANEVNKANAEMQEQTSITNNTSDIKDVDHVKVTVDSEPPKKKPSRKEKEPDGKCVICYEPVFNGVCSGCGTIFRR